MIIVTSNLVEYSWETIYGVYLLAETDIPIPWYVRKWGTNYLTPPEYITSEEGVYGFPLSPNLHKMRVCLFGQRWSEVASSDLITMVASHGINLVDHIGAKILEERILLPIIGIKW
jgi:hypothetical protein